MHDRFNPVLDANRVLRRMQNEIAVPDKAK